MSDQKNPLRIFIVGCPRSGTTLLQSILASHTEVEGVRETHFFSSLYRGPAPPLGRYNRAFEILNTLLREGGLGELVPGTADSEIELARALVVALDALAIRAGKNAWVEKTPSHVHVIDRIRSAVPGARFVHILRQGRAVVASLLDAHARYPKAWPWAHDVDACVNRWLQARRDSERWKSDPEHHYVSYEQLVRAPEAVVSELCRCLGLTFEPTMLRFQSQSRRLLLDDEGWNAGVLRDINDPGLNKFNQLPEETRQRIETMLGRDDSDPRFG